MDTTRIEVLTQTSPEDEIQISKLVEQLTPGSPLLAPEVFHRVLNNPNTRIMVVRNEKKEILGMATLVLIPKLQGDKKAVIEDVVVDETARGQGLGKMLIKKLLEEAEKLGVKQLFLTSRESREAANMMYQKMGFVKYETNNYRFDI